MEKFTREQWEDVINNPKKLRKLLQNEEALMTLNWEDAPDSIIEAVNNPIVREPKIERSLLKGTRVVWSMELIQESVPLSENFMEKFKSILDGSLIAKHQDLSASFIERNKDWLDADAISEHQKLSEFFIERNKDWLKMEIIVSCQNVSPEFIKTYYSHALASSNPESLEMAINANKYLSTEEKMDIKTFATHFWEKVSEEQKLMPKMLRNIVNYINDKALIDKVVQNNKDFYIDDIKKSLGFFEIIVNVYPNADINKISDSNIKEMFVEKNNDLKKYDKFPPELKDKILKEAMQEYNLNKKEVVINIIRENINRNRVFADLINKKELFIKDKAALFIESPDKIAQDNKSLEMMKAKHETMNNHIIDSIEKMREALNLSNEEYFNLRFEMYSNDEKTLKPYRYNISEMEQLVAKYGAFSMEDEKELIINELVENYGEYKTVVDLVKKENEKDDSISAIVSDNFTKAYTDTKMLNIIATLPERMELVLMETFDDTRNNATKLGITNTEFKKLVDEACRRSASIDAYMNGKDIYEKAKVMLEHKIRNVSFTKAEHPELFTDSKNTKIAAKIAYEAYADYARNNPHMQIAAKEENNKVSNSKNNKTYDEAR